MKKNLLFILLLVMVLFNSCATVSSTQEFTFLPKVLHPIYESYMHNGEKGYEIFFELKDGNAQPIAVVFNKIKKPITAKDATFSDYHINVIAHTSLIANYPIVPSKLPNGILFEHQGKYYLKKVNFVKKQ